MLEQQRALGKQEREGQKGSESDRIWLCKNCEVSSFFLEDGGTSMKHRKKEKGINTYWVPPTCLALYIHHLPEVSQRHHEGGSISGFFK